MFYTLENMSNLKYFNLITKKGHYYLEIIFAILNGDAQVDLAYLASELKATLKEVADLLEEDEEKIFKYCLKDFLIMIV